MVVLFHHYIACANNNRPISCWDLRTMPQKRATAWPPLPHHKKRTSPSNTRRELGGRPMHPPSPICVRVISVTCVVLFLPSLSFPPSSVFASVPLSFLFFSAFVLHLAPCVVRDYLPCLFAGVLAHLPLGLRLCCAAHAIIAATGLLVGVCGRFKCIFVVFRVCKHVMCVFFTK